MGDARVVGWSSPPSKGAELPALHPRALATLEDNTQCISAELGYPGFEGSRLIRSGWPHAPTEAGDKTAECCSCSSHCEVICDRARPACHPFTVDSLS